MARTRKADPPAKQPKAPSVPGLARDYLRGFAGAMEQFDDFASFLDLLKECLETDRYLAVEASVSADNEGAKPDLEAELAASGEGELFMQLVGASESAGGLRCQGRRDGKPFGPEDLHLMGALAEFVSALVRESRNVARSDKAMATLRLVLDQLPLGVACFAGDRSVLVANRVAKDLTGSPGDEALAALFLGKPGEKISEHVRFHFEAGGKLVYAEGRALPGESKADESALAFLLYDMGARRDRFQTELDRQSYRSRCLGVPFTAAFVRSESRAGAAYAALKEHVKELQVPPDAVQPVDAHTCGCVFPGRSSRSVRFLLQCHLAGFGLEDPSIAVVTDGNVDPESDDLGKALLAAGREGLAPATKALRPSIACLEAYAPVAETLSLLLEEVCSVRPVRDLETFLQVVAEEAMDGVFFDLDGHDAEDLARVREAAQNAGEGFKIFYSTYAQAAMARARYGLTADQTVVQKPFDAESLARAVHLQFNLA